MINWSSWIISSSILIFVVILLRYLFRGKISLRFQYALWLLVAVRLLVPVNVGESPLSVENLIPAAKAQPQIQRVLGKAYEDAYAEVVEQYENDRLPIEALSDAQIEVIKEEAYEVMESSDSYRLLREIAFTIWIAGICILSVVFLVSDIRFRVRVRNRRKKLELAEIKLPIYMSDAVETPCLFGILGTRIYVTRKTAGNPTLLWHAAVHEMTHYRHGDHIWSLLRCAALILHWYNPLVWWAAALSRRDAELACDEATIRRLGEEERAEYGRTLIQLTCESHQNLLTMATTMTSGKRSIKERIRLIAGKPYMKWYAFALTLAVVLLAAGTTCMGEDMSHLDVPEDFSFAIRCNAYGHTTYDSSTGKLVKTTAVKTRDKSEYVTTMFLNERELAEVYQLISELNVLSYPDEYEVLSGVESTPPHPFVLTVTTGEWTKKITCSNFAYPDTYVSVYEHFFDGESPDEAAVKFVETCYRLYEIMICTDAWRDLPDYEVYFE